MSPDNNLISSTFLDVTLIRLLEELRRRLANPEEVRLRLMKYLERPEDELLILELAEKLGLEKDRITDFIKTNSPTLRLLLARLNEIGAKEFKWPLSQTWQKDPADKGARVKFKIKAGEAAAIEVDNDGVLVDGAAVFDKDKYTYIRARLAGSVDAAVNVGGPLGAGTAAAAFGARAEVKLNNHFRHAPDELLATALCRDLASFALPGVLAAHPRALLPGQYVHMHAEGAVQVSASFALSRGFLSSVHVAEESLGIDNVIDVAAEVSASASLSYLLEGHFDILLSSAGGEEEGWLRVELAKSKTSERKTGFSLGATVGIKGLGDIGKSLLRTASAKLDKLIKTIEDDIDSYADLHKLFSGALDEALDATLRSKSVIEQTKKWMGSLAEAGEGMLQTLSDVLKEAAIDFSKPLIDNLQQNLDKAVKPIQELIKRYRRLLKTITDALQRAAQLKVELKLARAQTLIEKEDVALSFKIDAARRADVLDKMLLGDFSEALRLAETGDSGVVVDWGRSSMTASGSLRETCTIDLIAFGIQIGSASILSQEWEWSVSPTGQVLMGIRGEVEKRFSFWRGMRSASFFVDTKVLASLTDARRLTGVDVDLKFNLELTRDFRPSIPDLEGYLALLERMGLVPEAASPVKDLCLYHDRKNPFGELRCSLVLDLDESMFETVLDESAGAPRVFAENILRLDAPPPLRRFAADGQPVLLWPDVRKYFGYTTARDYISSSEFRYDGDKAVFQPEEMRSLAFFHFRVHRFEELLQRLRELKGLKLVALEPKEALGVIRGKQRDILGRAQELLSSKVQNSLFKTVLDVLSTRFTVSPYLIVLRRGDADPAGKREETTFIYETRFRKALP